MYVWMTDSSFAFTVSDLKEEGIKFICCSNETQEQGRQCKKVLKEVKRFGIRDMFI